MKKNEVLIKSNGLRNELKEIRKSIDKLTNALIKINNAQTNTHENNNNNIASDDDSIVRNNARSKD